MGRGIASRGGTSSVNASDIVGTINASQIGSVNAGAIVGTINSSQIGSVSAASITGLISATQIASVSATAISGTINASQIGSVNAATINGVIVTAQLADSILNTLSKFSTTLAPILRWSSSTNPPLPDPNYPLSAIILNTAQTPPKLYKNVSNAWTVISASSAISGQITSSDITSVSAGSITGLIVAGQIQSIATNQLTGSIQANQIAAVAASSITGTLTASQIGSINAATITIGLIGPTQISSVNASQINAGIINVGSGLTFKGSAGINFDNGIGGFINVLVRGSRELVVNLDLTAGGTLTGNSVVATSGTVSANSGFNIGSTSVIDFNRNASFVNLTVGGLPTFNGGVSQSATGGSYTVPSACAQFLNVKWNGFDLRIPMFFP